METPLKSFLASCGSVNNVSEELTHGPSSRLTAKRYRPSTCSASAAL